MKRRLVLSISVLLLCVCTWSAFYFSGHRLDCRRAVGGAFCALRSADGGGTSVQYVGGLTVWRWDMDGDNNRRVWPGEEK